MARRECRNDTLQATTRANGVPRFDGLYCITPVLLVFLAYLKGVSFADGLCAWDCNWYVQIADQGYDQTPHTGMNGNAANWPFFPLYPLLMRGTAALLPLSVKWIGLLITNASMYFAILLSLQYLKQTRTQCAELFWVGLCCFGPFSFFILRPDTLNHYFGY